MSSWCKFEEVQFSLASGPSENLLHKRFPEGRCGDMWGTGPSHLWIRTSRGILQEMSETRITELKSSFQKVLGCWAHLVIMLFLATTNFTIEILFWTSLKLIFKQVLMYTLWIASTEALVPASAGVQNPDQGLSDAFKIWIVSKLKLP